MLEAPRRDTRLHILAKRLPKVMGKAVDEQSNKDHDADFRACLEFISSGRMLGDGPTTFDRDRLIEGKAEQSRSRSTVLR